MKRYIFPLIASMSILASCDDTTDGLGTSLTDASDVLDVTTSTFFATSESFTVDSVLSRSSVGHLGKMRDPETGAYISANLMTQFYSQTDYGFPDAEIITSTLDGKIIADSCRLLVAYTSYTGDSLALMKCTLHELSKPVEESKAYYSNFDPIKEGYVRTDGGIHITKSYTLADQNIPASEKKTSSYTPYFRFNLNDEYTDSEGNTYNNYGTYLMNKYHEDKNNYHNFYSFVHKVCPGFFLESTSGVGGMMNIFTTQLEVYYRLKEEKDTVESVGLSRFSGTEEVLQLTNFTQDKTKLQELADDGSCTYLKTPSGIFTRIILPVDSIMRDYSATGYKLRKDTINTVRLNIKRENNHVTSDYSLAIPNTVLVLPSDSLNSFFANKEVANYRTSFLYNYSSASNSYSFNNISSIVELMAKAKASFYESHKGDANWTTDFDAKYEAEFPDWNKIAIIPVTTSYTNVGQSKQLTKVENDMSLTSTRLRGGKDNPNSIQIHVIYSKFRND